MKRNLVPKVDESCIELKKYSEELAALQSLLDSSLDIICSVDREGRFLHVSSAAKRVWGYEPEELTGCRYTDFVLPDDRPKTVAAVGAIMSGVEITSFENCYLKKDGTVVPILWSARWSEQEQIIYCVAKDASQIKAVEKKQKLHDRRLSMAYKLAEIAWWEFDVATQTYVSSDEIFSIYGLPIPPDNKTTLEEFISYVHPDDRAKLQSDLSTLCQDVYFNYEHRIVKPTGEVIFVIHFSEVIKDGNGNPIALHGTTKDITKRKLHQLKLEASERSLQQYSQRLSDILESIGDGFFAVDHNWTFTYWNKKAEELLRKKREDILGRNLWSAFKDVALLKFYPEFHRAINHNLAVQFEEYFQPLQLWVEVAAYPSTEGLSVYVKDITERKRQQAELQSSNERFALACRATNDIIWDWDVRNNTVLRSEGFTRYGYSPNELESSATSWVDVIHPDDREEVAESNRAALQNSEITYWEAGYRCRKSDGTYATVVDKGCIIRDELGRAVRMVGAMKDVTEQRRQENALRLANERFELVAKATSDALWDWDISNNTCHFNEGFTAMFGHGYTADLVYKNWLDNIHDEDKKVVVDSISEALNNVSMHQWQGEYRFYRHDKSIAHVLDRGFIIRDTNGRAERMVGSMQDITGLKETAAEMRRLSLVAKETENVVIITDAEDKITWVNKAFTDITEYTFEEAAGKRPGDLLQGPNTSERTKRYLRKCVEKKQPFHCEIINYTKSGREYWMEIKGQPLLNEKGELQQFFAIQTDITDRKEAEAAIKLSEEKYRLLFHNSPRPMWTFHADTLKVVDVNEAAVVLYGYSKQEFLRLTIDELKLPEERLELITAVRNLKNQKDGHFQKIVRHKKKNGEPFYIEVSSFTLLLPTGIHVMVTGSDMTEKLHLQQRLIAEKVAAQKQVARAIIHAQETERSEIGKELHDNICQLLTTAKLYIESIRHVPEQQEVFASKGIDLLMKSINEIRYLSRQLVSPVSGELDFENTVEELIGHYRAMNLFEICYTYEATIELVDKDLKTSIIRILQEQFNNTVKYARASAVHIHFSNTEDTLTLLYKDNGIGFDSDTVKRGIGLMNIKNRAGAYRGKVNLRTAVGEGCCMEISFPLTEQPELMY